MITIQQLREKYRTSKELHDLGGVCHGSDSYNQELWSFPDDISANFIQRTLTDDGPDEWTADIADMEGWFPDDDVEEWEDMVMAEN